MNLICLSLVQVALSKSFLSFVTQQGRKQGYRSRVRVGRVSEKKANHLCIWAGAVMQKPVINAEKAKCYVPTIWLTNIADYRVACMWLKSRPHSGICKGLVICQHQGCKSSRSKGLDFACLRRSFSRRNISWVPGQLVNPPNILGIFCIAYKDQWMDELSATLKYAMLQYTSL